MKEKERGKDETEKRSEKNSSSAGIEPASLYLWKIHRKPLLLPPTLFSRPVAPPPPPPPAGGSLLSMLTTQNTLINMKEVTD